MLKSLDDTDLVIRIAVTSEFDEIAREQALEFFPRSPCIWTKQLFLKLLNMVGKCASRPIRCDSPIDVPKARETNRSRCEFDLKPTRQSHEAALRRRHRCVCLTGSKIKHVYDRASDVFPP